MNTQLRSLVKDIEKCRNDMVRLASETSFLNQEVIELSMKLDGLLNKYHSLSTQK